MAKKKKPQSMPDLLEDIMSQLTPEEHQMALDLINSGPDRISKKLFKTYYHHQCPDYRSIVQPVAPYLMCLWTMEDISDLSPAELYASCSAIPQETLERDLRNFIFNIFGAYRQTPEKSYSYRLWYALGMMEHFHMERCLDIVLEILRQDMDFYEFYFGYLYETMLSAIIYQLGQNQLDVLTDFMKEAGLLPMAKYRVIEAVAHIVIAHPDRRDEVMKWCCELLNYYFEVLGDRKDDICSPLLLDHIAACMMDVRGVETLPILEKIYETYHIVPYGIPSVEELKEKMPYAEMFGLEMEKVEDYLAEAFEEEYDDAIYYDDEDDFDDEDDYDDDDDNDDEEEEDYEEAVYDYPLYMEGRPVKKLRIKIELEHSEPLIWRTLEVPSNICLERFAEVVEVAMGWDGYHLHQFIKGNTYYLPPEDDDFDSPLNFPVSTVDSGEVSLGELLSRKGSKLKYEYDFGDGWMHNIILESRQAYTGKETPAIVLLGGENACPPEDCGGIWGYMEMQEALKKPRSKAAREYKEWLGYKFDPAFFDFEETRRLLAAIID